MKPLDIETTGLDHNRDSIIGTGLGSRWYGTGEAYSLPEAITTQNGKFDIKFLNKSAGDNRWTSLYQFDCMLAASILIDRPLSLSLDSLALHYLALPSWKDATNKMFKEKNWVEKLYADPSRMSALVSRNLADIDVTGKLTGVLLARLKQEGMEDFFFKKLMPAARMLADCELKGMRIDIPATVKKLSDIDKKIALLLSQLSTWIGGEINWNSPKQVIGVLKSKGFNPTHFDFKKRLNVESSSSDCLAQFLPDENIQILLNYKKTVKLSGYLKDWLKVAYQGRIHPTFNIATTRTGRLSCTGPNLQQVPREKSIRSLFIPTEGKVFVIADYAQIEPRVAASYTEDVALLEVFNKGLDFYGSIANRVLGVKCHPNDVKKLFPKERAVSKEIGLSILYGIGAQKLSSLIQKKAGILFTKAQCAVIIKDYFVAYPNLLKFRTYVENKVLRGEVLETHYGRKFEIDPDKVFSTGVNTVVQSTASDACLFSQLEVDRRLAEMGISAPLIAIVHDEIIRECNPEDGEKVGTLMEEVMCDQGFKCNLKLDWAIGKSWGDKA